VEINISRFMQSCSEVRGRGHSEMKVAARCRIYGGYEVLQQV